MDMLTATGLILDAIVILSVLIPVIAGFTKGFKRRLLSLVALGVSALVAYVAAGLLAPQLYENVLREKTLEICVRTTSGFDPVATAKQSLDAQGISLDEDYVRQILTEADEEKIAAVREAAIEYGIDAEKAKELAERFSAQLPDQTAKALKEHAPKMAEMIQDGAVTNKQISEAVKAIVDSPETAAEYVEEHYAAPIVTAGTEAVLFALIFILMQLIMLLVFMLFGFDLKAKASSNGDRAAGVLLGLVCAAANLLVMCIVVTGFKKSGSNIIDIDSVNSLIFLPIYKKIY